MKVQVHPNRVYQVQNHHHRLNLKDQDRNQNKIVKKIKNKKDIMNGIIKNNKKRKSIGDVHNRKIR